MAREGEAEELAAETGESEKERGRQLWEAHAQRQRQRQRKKEEEGEWWLVGVSRSLIVEWYWVDGVGPNGPNPVTNSGTWQTELVSQKFKLQVLNTKKGRKMQSCLVDFLTIFFLIIFCDLTIITG